MAESAKKDDKLKPRDVLYDEMVFYRDKANKLGNQIAEFIRAGDKARGDVLFNLYKLMLSNKKQLIEVASLLAPYEHAKLQSVEMKAAVEHRFVIRSPEKIKDTAAWLKEVGVDKEPILVSSDDKNKKYDSKIDDIEEFESDSIGYIQVPRSKKSDNVVNIDDYVPPDDRFD